MHPGPAASASCLSPREILSFRLGREEYGIDILLVQEIRRFERPARIANAPGFMKGILNLRGTIVPIIDLRVKLGYDPVEHDQLAAIIVLNFPGLVIGAAVDSVSDVLMLDDDDIRPPPELGSAVNVRHILGIGHVKTGEGQRMLILSDIEAMVASCLYADASEPKVEARV